ncbi:Triosephosphate isomerase [subsurface metagenome]
MRNKIVAGNWKMNMTFREGIELANEINNLVSKSSNRSVKVILGPPFIHLAEVQKIVDAEFISIAAQNCASEPGGAYTGEISVEMIQSTGAKYVIIGHSERRAYFGEEEQILNKKVNLALAKNLIPIFCCGERLEEREKGIHFDIVKNQLDKALFDLEESGFRKIAIAYEPVWAIGTGVNATPDQAQEMHRFIRNLIVERYGNETAESISILYGGSCKPSNAKELFANPDVDGGLIGGASLKADDFFTIINSLTG